MFALISWSSKNGVALGREELEVRSTSKLTIMNGGKMEPGATVNMQYKKDIWGGTIQSIHVEKRDADKQLDNEVSGPHISHVEEVPETTEDQSSSKKGQRKRKKKSYGKDFEENEESDNSEESDISGLTTSQSPVVKETNGQAKKTNKRPKSSDKGQENGKKRKASTAEKERNLSISSQHDELMITQILGDCTTSGPIQASKAVPPHPHFGGKQLKQHKSPKCISVICKEEKEMLEEQLRDTKQELNALYSKLEKAQEELTTLKALQTGTTDIDCVKYGKLPRSVGMAKNWEEISNGVWCCPVKVKAAIKNSSTRTAVALALFGIFYPKEELDGRRLHELDQDVIEAITDFSLVAKLVKEPTVKKLKEGEEPKPPSPVSRSTIKQAMRMKCNSVISLQRRKAEK